MKVKLTASEYKVLLTLFREIIEPIRPADMRAKMLHGLLIQVADKIYRKGIAPRGYTISMSAPEAIAFYYFWTNYELPTRLVFERVMIQHICNKIHQQYS